MKRMRLFAGSLAVTLMMFSCMGCSKEVDNQDEEKSSASAVTSQVSTEESESVDTTEQETSTEESETASTQEQEIAPTQDDIEEPGNVDAAPVDVYKYTDYYNAFAQNDAVPPTVNVCTDKSKKTVRVSSVEELVAAIAPNTTVIIEAGEYNISDYVDSIIENDAIEGWNYRYDNVTFEEVFDGYELHIHGANGLRIVGGGDKREDTQVVTDPRYAALFVFDNCRDVIVSNFTTGHTKLSECSGNVIDLYGTSDVIFDNMDMYGCGVLGIGMYDNSGNILVKDSYIHDCSMGTIDASSLWGTLICVDCVFTGSGHFGFTPDEEQDYEAVMYRCEFGPNEATVMFRQYFRDVDCVWAEPAYYPEYEDYDPGFEEDYYEPDYED